MLKLTSVIPIPLKETTNGLNPASRTFASDCTFEKGKNYLVIAASGRGKSTLLHILYGLRKDYEGQVFLDKNDIRQFSADTWAEYRQKRLSIVFQDLRLFPDLTAMENILLKSELNQTMTEDEVRQMAVKTGIEPVLNQTCQTLSYGQRQRVAIIRALCQPFDFLLLDEPFSHLDDANIRVASLLIEERCRQLEAGLILVSFGERYYFNYDEEWQL